MNSILLHKDSIGGVGSPQLCRDQKCHGQTSDNVSGYFRQSDNGMERLLTTCASLLYDSIPSLVELVARKNTTSAGNKYPVTKVGSLDGKY
jgi:hypothetical protein